MPELPEVETIKLGLQKHLVGHKILDVQILNPRVFFGEKKDVINAKVIDVKRAGKGLIIKLGNEYDLIIHLKMTGQLIFQDEKTKSLPLSKKTGGELPSKFTRVIFNLNNNSFLFFNDIRMFGWIKIIKKSELGNFPFFKNLGLEPFVGKTSSGQAILSLDLFKKIIKLSGSPIKIVLMDQKKIAGIGNIYANEALFVAKIDPRKKAKSLTDKEIEKLYEAIFEVLKKGIKYGGASDVNFVNALGQDGKFQEHFLIYGRAGKKCFNCKGIVRKITLGGRGTFFCSECQK